MMRLKTLEITSLALVGSSLKPAIYILDFNDSFTYNIYSTLRAVKSDLVLEVILYSDIPLFLRKISATENKCGVIFGPGPGHPSEYSFVHSYLESLFKNSNIFVLGICLGHQIILEYLGLKIIRSKSPVHGQVADYTLSKEMASKLNCSEHISVQRYNSLAVEIDEEKMLQLNKNFHHFEREIIISLGERLVTYQFHPESIGTTCPNKFFMRLVNFLI